MVEDLVNVKMYLTTRLRTISAENNTFSASSSQKLRKPCISLRTKASVHVSAREAYLHGC